MAIFRYQALNSQQQPVTGEVEADGVQHAIAQLEAAGLMVQSIGYAAAASSSDAVESRPRPMRLIDEGTVLQTHLARLLEGGKPIVPALRAYAEEMPWGRRRRELQTMVRVLEQGDPTEAERVFASLPDYWIPLLSAATSSRDPARVLHEFLEESRRADELRRQWWLMLAYPLFVVFLAMAVVIALSVMVIPSFGEIFDEFDLQLPALTLLVLNVARWVTSGWFFVIVILLIAAAALALFAGRSTQMSRRRGLGNPLRAIFGRPTAIARFARFTADLLEAGLPIPDALRIAGFTTNRVAMQRAAWRLANDMESGVFAAGQFERPPVTATILYALSSEMPVASRIRLLRQVGDANAERTRVRLSWTRGIIEPLAICVIGLVVAMVVLGLFLPLVNLINGLSG